MFENKPPQNLPTASEPQDMLGDADTASTPVPPQTPEMMPPQDLDRTNSDPHSGGFRFGEGGIENGPSALDAGKLRPVAGGMSTEAPAMPNMEMPKTQMQAVPESVGGMGTAPLEDSVFSKHRVLIGVLVGLLVFGGVAYGAMMLLVKDSDSKIPATKIENNNAVVPVEQVDAIVPVIPTPEETTTTEPTTDATTTATETSTTTTTTDSATTTTNVGTTTSLSTMEEARTSDEDGDGLTMEEEIKNGTDPKKVDTDSDGLTDKEEVNIWKSNPLLADTDGDGFTDGAEVKSNYSPIGPGRIYPEKPQTVNP